MQGGRHGKDLARNSEGEIPRDTGKRTKAAKAPKQYSAMFIDDISITTLEVEHAMRELAKISLDDLENRFLWNIAQRRRPSTERRWSIAKDEAINTVILTGGCAHDGEVDLDDKITTSAPIAEGPCCNCSRTNDTISKKCWWCEAENPVKC